MFVLAGLYLYSNFEKACYLDSFNNVNARIVSLANYNAQYKTIIQATILLKIMYQAMIVHCLNLRTTLF